MSTDARTLARAKSLRSSQTDAEQRLWYYLRAHRFQGIKFKRQKPIGPYIVDFVAPDRGLVIELDGGQHVEQSARDEQRTQRLQSEGYRVLRFWNDDVPLRTDAVLDQIRLALESQPLSPNPSPASGRGEHRKS
jgi:very-short-patch-repair endonuclease